MTRVTRQPPRSTTSTGTNQLVSDSKFTGATDTTSDTGELDIAAREHSESKSARSKQRVDGRDPGDEGHGWVATESDCAVSGATS